MNKAPGGVEPSTFCLLGRRSNQLSYRAIAGICQRSGLIDDMSDTYYETDSKWNCRMSKHLEKEMCIFLTPSFLFVKK